MTALSLLACQSGGPAAGDDTAQGRDTQDTAVETPEFQTPDQNGDGTVRILVVGSSASIDDGSASDPGPVADALRSLLEATDGLNAEIDVVAEDLYTRAAVTLGLGGGGSEVTYTHHSHSLLQYRYWPDGETERQQRLASDWDYVVLAADPAIVRDTPGYHALGVGRVAEPIAEGGGIPLLLMTWDQAEDVSHAEEVSYRIADGSPHGVQVVPAALAWKALEAELQNSDTAYLSAASIYSHITGVVAPGGDETQQALAEVAEEIAAQAKQATHHSGDWAQDTPFAPCGITEDTLAYNHTGTSSERGILDGLKWVFDQAPQTLQNGGLDPITFNYGRANTNFEADKRYQIDPERFSYSFGFPMQDHGNHGDTSLRYGLDKRDGGVVNDTDLGVARYMIQQGEVPYGRAIPVRSLYAQMHAIQPEASAYRDSWHMSRDLDKAIGAYMYTLLTGGCALGEEPADAESAEWMTWRSHKVGCDTAWTVMTLETRSPF